MNDVMTEWLSWKGWINKMANVCADYLDLEGRCFNNGSWCLFPCDAEKCRSVWEDGITKNYSPSKHEKLTERTLFEVRKAIGIEPGDAICEKYISNKNIDDAVDAYSLVMTFANEALIEMKSKGYKVRPNDFHIIQNVRLYDDALCCMVICKGS